MVELHSRHVGGSSGEALFFNVRMLQGWRGQPACGGDKFAIECLPDDGGRGLHGASKRVLELCLEFVERVGTARKAASHCRTHHRGLKLTTHSPLPLPHPPAGLDPTPSPALSKNFQVSTSSALSKARE